MWQNPQREPLLDMAGVLTSGAGRAPLQSPPLRRFFLRRLSVLALGGIPSPTYSRKSIVEVWSGRGELVLHETG